MIRSFSLELHNTKMILILKKKTEIEYLLGAMHLANDVSALSNPANNVTKITPMFSDGVTKRQRVD